MIATQSLQVSPASPVAVDTAAASAPRAFVAMMYHNVCAGPAGYSDLSPSATSYFVRRDAFERQAAELGAGGVTCMTPEQLRAFYAPSARTLGLTTPVQSTTCPVLLTFDDGWRGGVELGGPVLAEYHCRAIVFVTTDFLGKPHFLSRADIGRLDAEVFQVGSHARSHRMLCLLGETEIRSELLDSKKLLEDLTGYEIDMLSIPSGAVDGRVRRIAAECGYRLVFDSEVRVNRRGDSPAAIGRVAVMHDTPLPVFRRCARQRLAPERLRRAVLLAPKRLLGLKRYERLRRYLLGEARRQAVTQQS